MLNEFSAPPSAMSSSESQFQIHFFLSELLHDPCFILFSFFKDFFFIIVSFVYLCHFSDVNPFACTSEVPSGIIVDKTECLSIEDQIHFLLADYLSLLNECFKPFEKRLLMSAYSTFVS